jgi:hypothetical protein
MKPGAAQAREEAQLVFKKVRSRLKRILQTIVVLAAVAVIASGAGNGSLPYMPDGPQVSRASKPIDIAADKIRDDEQAIAALVKMGVPLQRDTLGRVRWIEAVQGEFSDEAMRHLSGLPLLEWLEIGGGKVTAAGMMRLKGCSALRRLYVHDVHLSDDALAVLSNRTRLEALSLQNTGITGKGVKHLNAPGSLRVLNLSGDDIGDEDLAQIARFSGLEVLALQNTKVSGAGLAKLAGMKRLNVLNLSNCRIVDNDLDYFTSMPNLRIVHASGCNIGDKAIQQFKEKLPMLAIFK